MKQGWELKTLKDVGAIFSGNSINAKIKEEKYSGLSDGLPYVATKDIGYDSIINYKNGIKIPYDESGSFRIAPKNSVLICAEGGSAGRKIGRLAQDVCFVNKLFAITPDNEITSKYLYYWYKSNAFKEEFNSRLTGLIGGVSKRKFETIPIPISSLEEQKQIVAKLDQCFEAIDKARANAAKNLENAKELFQSKLNEIFSQKGGGWVEKKVSKLVDERVISKPLDGNHGDIHPKKSEFVEKGVPFLMSSNLREGVVDQENCNFISREQADGLRKGFALDGDVLLSHKGTIGRSAILSTEFDYVMLTPQLTYYRVLDKGALYNKFLYYCFLTTSFQKEINNVAGSGSTRAYIGITRQLDLKIKYPSYKEQVRLSLILDQLTSSRINIESKYQQELNSLEELKKSILQKAFEGEL